MGSSVFVKNLPDECNWDFVSQFFRSFNPTEVPSFAGSCIYMRTVDNLFGRFAMQWMAGEYHSNQLSVATMSSMRFTAPLFMAPLYLLYPGWHCRLDLLPKPPT